MKWSAIRIMFSFALIMLVGDILFAQVPVQAPNTAPVQTPIGGGGVIVRSLWTEIFITLIMFGAALFAVGRSSNRS